DGEPGESLYILIHTAHNPGGPRWETPEGGLLESYRGVVIDKLKRFGMTDIEDRIVVEETLTPDDIDRMYNAEGGAIYGLASHGKLTGGFKPRNRSSAFENLYLTGGSSNPGPGVPMVLMSGVTAARCVCEDFGIAPKSDPLGAAEPGELPAGSRVLEKTPTVSLAEAKLPRSDAGVEPVA
ncbi:MAG: hypothetical protein AAF235_04400, partial [Planctomycetota bacterium]